ncbi:MAG: PBP1A family penicillin-binding protein [Acidobacteriota bacterium]
MSWIRVVKKTVRTKARSPWWRRGAAVVLVALVAAAFWVLAPFWQLAGQLEGRSPSEPSRLYGANASLSLGEKISLDEVEALLTERGYRAVAAEASLEAGTYLREDGALAAKLRSFLSPEGAMAPSLLQVRVRDQRIVALEWGGERVRQALLDPTLIGSVYGPQRIERRAVTLEEVPDDLVRAVLAMEDDDFFRHAGVSVTGILRAAWVNFRGGTVRQGGSTLTQQLVKNLFLTHERTVSRKVREMLLAVLVEMRYSKQAILEAYLNEIYLGSVAGTNLHGVGAASWAYFHKPVEELTLEEAAALAGMIPAPAIYHPLNHPERCLERRDRVLDRIGELKWLDPELLATARQAELKVEQGPLRVRFAPYFSDYVTQEAQQRFGIHGLEDAGYQLLTTLDAKAQERAEEAVSWGLESLEEGWQKNHEGPEPLQGSLVAVDPESGGIRAYVGGRDYGTSQFDRVAGARRQAGSAFKPVVYAAAFERGVAAPSSLVDDSPITVTLAGRRWSPQNDDDDFEGWMSVRTAVERSRNVPTVRLALETGLKRVVELARGLGFEGRMEPLPSLALGAFEVTALEMATAYGTLASGGVRPPAHGLTAIYTATGEAVPALETAEGERVISPQSAYLLTSVLQGVFERGTARRARYDGLRGPLAGKTGTTNDRRDSWFGGYSSRLAAVVWVGYDDNSTTRLSGTRAALPIWSRFIEGVSPSGGWPRFEAPEGIVTAAVDPASGDLATESCPDVLVEVFREGYQPADLCPLHSRWWHDDRRPRRDRQDREREQHPFRRWFDRVFGQEEEARRNVL